MAGRLTTQSRKEKVPKGWTYLLGLMDIHAALEPRLTRDAYLSVNFSPKQAYRKEQRDAVDERRQYRVLEAAYSPGRTYLPRLPGLDKPWEKTARPEVVTAEVLAVPREALPRGVAVRPLLQGLLEEAFLRLTPNGLPVDLSPRNAWLLEVVLDASVARLEAALSPWNGGEHQVSERLRRQLSTVENDLVAKHAMR